MDRIGFTVTIGAYFAATGRNNELTEGQVDNPDAQEFMKSIERSVVHYVDPTLTFLANLRRRTITTPHRPGGSSPGGVIISPVSWITGLRHRISDSGH